jgi:hypothetical protein
MRLQVRAEKYALSGLRDLVSWSTFGNKFSSFSPRESQNENGT